MFALFARRPPSAGQLSRQRWHRRLAVLLLSVPLPFVLPGCATVLSQTYTKEDFVRSEVVDSPPQGTPALALRWRFEGDQLLVTPERWRTCWREETRVFHRTRITQNELKDDPRVLELLSAGVLVGVGAAGLARPGVIDTSDDAKLGMIVGGGALALLALVDTLRTIDSTEDAGQFRVPSGNPASFACEEDQAEEVVLRLQLPDGRVLEPQRRGELLVFGLDGVTALATGDRHTALLQAPGGVQPVSLLLFPPYHGAYLAARTEAQP